MQERHRIFQFVSGKMTKEDNGISTSWNTWVDNLFRPASIYPLVGLRIAFGFSMALWAAGMLLTGKVTQLFYKPRFFFPYEGLEWIQPLKSPGVHLVFVLIALAALMIAAGWFYRISTIVFTFLFTYISLIDKASYLSYYYYVLVLSVMLMLSPANRLFSFDQLRKTNFRADYVPNWCILAFKIQVVMVFYFAGMAKLNADWLFGGRPAMIWLTEILGKAGISPDLVLENTWIPIVFSWLLLLFDFMMPQFLYDNKTSVTAFKIVCVVQLLAMVLLPTGFFPVLIVLSCIIFLPADLIHSLISRIAYFLFDIFEFKDDVFNPGGTVLLQYRKKRLFPILLAGFLFMQICVPVSLFLNWGSDRWADAAFSFSWDVRVNEKHGVITFFQLNQKTGEERVIDLNFYLSKMQQNKMAEDPEMIDQFASYLYSHHNYDPGLLQLKAVSCISLNGRKPDCRSFLAGETIIPVGKANDDSGQ